MSRLGQASCPAVLDSRSDALRICEGAKIGPDLEELRFDSG